MEGLGPWTGDESPASSFSGDDFPLPPVPLGEWEGDRSPSPEDSSSDNEQGNLESLIEQALEKFRREAEAEVESSIREAEERALGSLKEAEEKVLKSLKEVKGKALGSLREGTEALEKTLTLLILRQQQGGQGGGHQGQGRKRRRRAGVNEPNGDPAGSRSRARSLLPAPGPISASDSEEACPQRLMTLDLDLDPQGRNEGRTDPEDAETRGGRRPVFFSTLRDSLIPGTGVVPVPESVSWDSSAILRPQVRVKVTEGTLTLTPPPPPDSDGGQGRAGDELGDQTGIYEPSQGQDDVPLQGQAEGDIRTGEGMEIDRGQGEGQPGQGRKRRRVNERSASKASAKFPLTNRGPEGSRPSPLLAPGDEGPDLASPSVRPINASGAEEACPQVQVSPQRPLDLDLGRTDLEEAPLALETRAGRRPFFSTLRESLIPTTGVVLENFSWDSSTILGPQVKVNVKVTQGTGLTQPLTLTQGQSSPAARGQSDGGELPDSNSGRDSIQAANTDPLADPSSPEGSNNPPEDTGTPAVQNPQNQTSPAAPPAERVDEEGVLTATPPSPGGLGDGEQGVPAHKKKRRGRKQKGKRTRPSCYFCQKTFPSLSALESHLRTHTNEKPFPCPTCHTEFAENGHLNLHIRRHVGRKTFKCPQEGCSSSFVTKGELRSHSRVHSGEKPFPCSYPNCGSSFRRKGDLKKHSRTHSGERPFACPLQGCGKTFTTSSHLASHRRICGVKGSKGGVKLKKK